MSNVTLSLDENPSPEDFRTIIDGVRKFNQAQTGNEWPWPVAYFLRDEDGRILGGIQGSLWGCSIHIDGLWIDESLRGQGHGSTLMKSIEDYAIAQGHLLVFLETASFQALPFYQKLGYRIFGELPGVTEGHTLYYLSKELRD